MVLTIDIGGTYTKYALVQDGTLVKKGKWKTVEDFRMILEKSTALSGDLSDISAFQAAASGTKTVNP